MKMTVRIADYYQGGTDYEEKKVKDLAKWIKKHGKPVLVYPPTVNRDHWIIFTSSSGRFTQR